MVSNRMLWLIAVGGLSLPIFAQDAASVAPIPNDPLDLATAEVQSADTPASRSAAIELLARARNSYGLRAAGQGYDLKTSFTVNSHGATEYDGAWQMEDTFDPKQGLRWTAKTAGYSITEIHSKAKLYAEETAGYIPLRLHEARAALFDAMPSGADLERVVVRTSTTTFHGTPVSCVLLSPFPAPATAPGGRRWDEIEECIDPQSGLLQVHSQVPGRYFAYEYSNAPQFAGHVLPRKVTITEGGKIVSEISVDDLQELPAADSSLFRVSEQMKERGRAPAMAEAQKVWHVVPAAASGAGAGAHTVCVFGLITASGQLVEAHSLQPSDPASQAAVEDANQMNFRQQAPPGKLRAPPRQHLVFIIENFVPSP
jgi:hypothetical protein